LTHPSSPNPFSRRRRGEILDFLFPYPAGEGLGVRANSKLRERETRN